MMCLDLTTSLCNNALIWIRFSAIIHRRPFTASKQHVPCLAHVINLAVQAMLGKNGLGAEAPKDVESLDVEDDDDTEGFIQTTIMEEEEEEEEEDDTSESLEEDKVSTKYALQKLRKGIVKIRCVLLHSNSWASFD